MSSDSLDTLASATGLSRAAMLEIHEAVKANQALLNGCPYHEFSPILPRVPLRQRYRCINCGGEIDASAHYWHEQGRRPAAS